MNEFGIDTAFDENVLTQSMVDQIYFAIDRLCDLGYVGSGTSAYYNKTATPDANCLPNMQLVQTTNNKPAGMYFFSHAWDATSAAFEANYCCDQLDAWGFNPRLGVFMDFERLAQTGRVGGFENLIYINGGWPSAALMQSIVSSWCTTILSRGYKPGFYMNMDPINAITDSWIQTNRFNPTLGEPFFWLAQWGISSPSWDCDIWQYEEGQYHAWNGITADYNQCWNDRIWTTGSTIPLWLKIYLANRGEKNGKCTVFL